MHANTATPKLLEASHHFVILSWTDENNGAASEGRIDKFEVQMRFNFVDNNFTDLSKYRNNITESKVQEAFDAKTFMNNTKQLVAAYNDKYKRSYKYQPKKVMLEQPRANCFIRVTDPDSHEFHRIGFIGGNPFGKYFYTVYGLLEGCGCQFRIRRCNVSTGIKSQWSDVFNCATTTTKTTNTSDADTKIDSQERIVIHPRIYLGYNAKFDLKSNVSKIKKQSKQSKDNNGNVDRERGYMIFGMNDIMTKIFHYFSWRELLLKMKMVDKQWLYIILNSPYCVVDFEIDAKLFANKCFTVQDNSRVEMILFQMRNVISLRVDVYRESLSYGAEHAFDRYDNLVSAEGKDNAMMKCFTRLKKVYGHFDGNGLEQMFQSLVVNNKDSLESIYLRLWGVHDFDDIFPKNVKDIMATMDQFKTFRVEDDNCNRRDNYEKMEKLLGETL